MNPCVFSVIFFALRNQLQTLVVFTGHLAAKHNLLGCNFSKDLSYNSTLLVKYMLTCAGRLSGSEKMIELKLCLSYTMWISTHMTDGIPGCQDNWTLIRLSLIPTAMVAVGVDNSTRGTMCCVPLKLVPWVKRTGGPSDGDSLIRDSQVFYHSVRLKQIAFWAGIRWIHVDEYFFGSAAASQMSVRLLFSFQVSNPFSLI